MQTPAVERSFSDVVQDIVRNLQDIIRSEVRLARTEVSEELMRARAAALLLGIGVLSGIFGVFFVLLAMVYALSYAVPEWAAALIVAFASALFAGIAITNGVKRFKHVNPASRTLESLKENVEWVRQRIK